MAAIRETAWVDKRTDPARGCFVSTNDEVNSKQLAVEQLLLEQATACSMMLASQRVTPPRSPPDKPGKKPNWVVPLAFGFSLASTPSMFQPPLFRLVPLFFNPPPIHGRKRRQQRQVLLLGPQNYPNAALCVVSADGSWRLGLCSGVRVTVYVWQCTISTPPPPIFRSSFPSQPHHF
jgi:hypothetical protein